MLRPLLLLPRPLRDTALVGWAVAVARSQQSVRPVVASLHSTQLRGRRPAESWQTAHTTHGLA